MNKIYYIVMLLLVVLNCNVTFSQEKSFVKLYLNDGQEMFVSTIVTTYQGKLVFPSDDKSYIRYKANDKKIKIAKKEVVKIQLGNDVYEKFMITIRGREYSFFATRIAEGAIIVYKAFPYDHMSGVGPGGASQSINKIAFLQYYYLEDGKLKEADFKKDEDRLSSQCSEFAAYIKTIKKLKRKNFEEAVAYYNNNCNN